MVGLNPNTNRRKGVAHEGVFLGWMRERGHVSLHMAPNQPGDNITWAHGRCYIFEVKRKKLTNKKGGRSYRFSTNPQQHEALQKLATDLAKDGVVVLYAISFLHKDHTWTTRFVSPFYLGKTVSPDDGLTWEQMGL